MSLQALARRLGYPVARPTANKVLATHGIGSYHFLYMAQRTVHPGTRLREFRTALGISLREAARQLNVAHPVLKDWEDGVQTPVRPYRDAIEVWTKGAIKSSSWPVSERERDVSDRAAAVRPFSIPERKTGS